MPTRELVYRGNILEIIKKGQPNGVASLNEYSKVPLNELPSFSSVATTGDYNDLINKPNILNIIKKGEPDGVASLDSTGTVPLTELPSFADVAFDGDYTKLINKPIVPDISSIEVKADKFEREGVTYNLEDIYDKIVESFSKADKFSDDDITKYYINNEQTDILLGKKLISLLCNSEDTDIATINIDDYEILIGNGIDVKRNDVSVLTKTIGEVLYYSEILELDPTFNNEINDVDDDINIDSGFTIEIAEFKEFNLEDVYKKIKGSNDLTFAGIDGIHIERQDDLVIISYEGESLFVLVLSLDDVTNPKTNKIYLVPEEIPQSGTNNFIEYIWLNDEWEKIGERKVNIDLSNYYNKTEIDTKIIDLVYDIKQYTLAGYRILVTADENIAQTTSQNNPDALVFYPDP